MAFGSSFKQILTMLVVSEQDYPPSSALMIALFNTIFNSTNTILSTWTATSRSPSASSSLAPSPLDLIGPGLYLTGLLVEMISELQRTAFKKDPANKGKPHAGDLFSLARHINYGGYALWRASFAFTAGGWGWGLAVFAFFFYDFAYRGVPVLDAYLSQRVRSQICSSRPSWVTDHIISIPTSGWLSKPASRTV